MLARFTIFCFCYAERDMLSARLNDPVGQAVEAQSKYRQKHHDFARYETIFLNFG